MAIIEGTLTRDFRLQVFFSINQLSPGPLSIPEGPFQIFTKIRADIRNSVFTAGVNDTNDKLFISVNDTGDNLSPVSLSPAICHCRCLNMEKNVLIYLRGRLHSNILTNFQKNSICLYI